MALGVAGALLATVASAATIDLDPVASEAAGKTDPVPSGTCQAGAPTFEEAAALAEECGHDVEWTGGRSEFETSFATPEGYVRWNTSTGAVRAQTDEGTWGDVDTTIAAESEDGRLVVAAPAYPMSFSDGTPGEPLARIERDGHVLEFDAPFDLTEPEVHEDKVVYPGVLGDDGISLVVSVDDDGTGFREVIQVDTPEAAANPALAELTFPVKVSTGLEVVASEDGHEVVQPSTGSTIFRSPMPHAWDSSGDSVLVGAQDVASVGVGSRSDTADGADVARSAAAPETFQAVDRTVAPVDGDTVVPLATALSEDGSALTITPDAELLSGDAETTWPVYIDPSWTGSLQGWAYVQSGWTSTVHWRPTDETLRAGMCPGTGCNGSGINRSAWQFDGLGVVGALEPSQIVSATFGVFGDHSYSCTATEVQLWWTGGIHSGTNWNNLGFIRHLSSQTVAHKASCGNQRWIYFDALGGAQETAKANASQLTLGLIAADEWNVAGWHRYRHDAALSIVWANSAPGAPTSMKVSDPAAGCENPWVRSKTPTLSVIGSDPDSPVTGEKIRANFEVWEGSTKVASSNPPTATYASGSTITWKVSTTLKENVKYTWYSSIGDALGATGPATSCTFTVDTTAPVQPTVTPVTTGVDAVYAGPEAGGVGMTGKFSLGVGTATDVLKFQCSFVSANQLADCGTPASNQVSFTPTSTGPITLFVTSVDKSGLSSAVTSYVFNVAYPAETGLWLFDDGLTDLSASDTSTAAIRHPLTLSGAAGQVTGPHQLFGARAADSPDLAMMLDGATASASTGVAVVDTTKSYTVAALVRLSAGATARGKAFTAVAQDGKASSGFTLGYRPTGEAGCTTPGGCWAMSVPSADGSATVAKSVAPLAAAEERWTLLVGERNASAGTVRMWACDIGTPDDPTRGEPLAGNTASLTQKWAANGSFTVGRAKVQGAAAERWPGAIDDVRVFSGQVVAESKIRRLCQGAEAGDFSGGALSLDPTEPIND